MFIGHLDILFCEMSEILYLFFFLLVGFFLLILGILFYSSAGSTLSERDTIHFHALNDGFR